MPIDGSYELLSGVMQGDTLAPYLFIMVLDCLLSELDHLKRFPLSDAVRSQRVTRLSCTPATNYLHEFGYADDLMFPFKNFEDMQPLLQELQLKARSIGLEINLKKGKTEYMVANLPDDTVFPDVLGFGPSGEPVAIHRTDDYRYLGTQVFSLEGQLHRRVGLAWSAVRKFRAFWDSKCPRYVKSQLFKCLVQSALTYGMELLTLLLVFYHTF